MKITYKEIKEFNSKDLEELFLSVDWESGKFPEKLQRAMQNSCVVISAWDGDKLVGLVRGLDDGETVGFIHYLLVNPDYQGFHIGAGLMNRIMEKYKNLLHIKVMPSDPKTVPFYEKFGLYKYENYTAMEKKNM